VRPETAPHANVLTAERPGNGPSQDRLIVLPDAVVLLDGASGTDGVKDGGWYADQLGAALRHGLTERPDTPLPDLLADAIVTVTTAHDLRPGESPSSTAAILRWNADSVDALVLGDSAVIAFPADGEPEVIEDCHLADVAAEQRHAYRARLAQGHGFDDGHRQLLRHLVEAERQRRNRPDGYWIAETDPEAAAQALVRTWPRTSLRSALLASDGITAAVNHYQLFPTWSDARSLVETQGAHALVDAVHDAEASDPTGRRWPRSKRHDDKSLALITLQGVLSD
jgi:hypothetical protein